MSYRIGEHKHHKPNRTMAAVSTPQTIFIENGTVKIFAVPCWYVLADPPVPHHGHNRLWHDHIGWPSPEHADHICQKPNCGHGIHHEHAHCARPLLDPNKTFPIHLTTEGYQAMPIALYDSPVGLTGEAWIDDDDDWVVKFQLQAALTNAVLDDYLERKKKDIPFAIRVTTGTARDERIDTVTSGRIIITPSPLGL